ncbi:probable 2,3-bisphosphoglycerate-independent phosphoglycerate mutase [Brassica napus]|uniref:probable 2,3-bisphosphoglycerate-independent phosphoglycerate mutase n=1 Tax=Brassica napus TaxID=3708 RepID=UPI0006AA9361|nr:probable 2,3-bisphosphoglycerate-independent phosphoglycerate mutase [Brassica napus]XP_048602965.1 probable 2,3-bisphosphoglycerate-independent phosphoglycerate mutase [Brassica napus]
MGQGDGDVKKRVAFVLIDGLGDVSIPRLGYKTPLQAANIPNLDAIASAGINGLMDPVEVGLGCGSDTAHLSLMGYDPRVYYRGRGAFESMGAGLAMSPGDIAFKSNFATLDESSGVVVSRRADRHFEEEGPILCAALDGMKLPSFPEYEVRVRYATEHRCGVVVKGPKLSGNISRTDPLKDNRLLLEAKPLDESEEAKHTAKVVNELSREISRILVSHPVNAMRLSQGKNIANLVLLRGCGIRIEVPPFEVKHGLWPCMVAPTKIIAGLGMSLGIDILEAPGATGDYRTLLTSKAVAIANALSAPLNPCPNVFVPGEDGHKPGRSDGYDFGFLHIKAIDDAGHDKATLFKVRGLEAVDKAIRQLAKLLWQAETSTNYQYFLCVTGDHSTPVEYGDHSFEPVPFTMCRLREFVAAVGGEAALLETSLEPFPLPTVVESAEYLAGKEEDGERRETPEAVGGDSVAELNEIAAARGCLGRFHGGEMMGVITKFLNVDVSVSQI